MIMSGWSVHFLFFFLGKFEQGVIQYFVHILSRITDNDPLFSENNRQLHINTYILEDFENASPYFCSFLANRICD